MSIRIHNFGGWLGFKMQKYLPYFCSNAYLKLQYVLRRKSQKEYIDYFNSKNEIPLPLVVSIETINRCNSTCSFCASNKYAEKRDFKRMSDHMFYGIIDQLSEWGGGYNGHLVLYGNNEPWLDTRIVDFHKYCREKLPKAFIAMSTNGTLLDIDKVKSILPYVDQLIINNYCDDMKLHDNIQTIYNYFKKRYDETKGVDILIQMRYINAVLTNRAGGAPNKVMQKKAITELCMLPYTDIYIFPDGKIGMCCCDNYETTNLGDLNKNSINDIWTGKEFGKIREKIKYGRHMVPFCKNCDFIDVGLRTDASRDIRFGKKMHGARQSLLRKNI